MDSVFAPIILALHVRQLTSIKVMRVKLNSLTGESGYGRDCCVSPAAAKDHRNLVGKSGLCPEQTDPSKHEAGESHAGS